MGAEPGMVSVPALKFAARHILVDLAEVKSLAKATGAPWQIEAYYQDEYVKRDGRWLFQSRTVVPLIPPPPLEAIATTWEHTST